MNKFGLDNSEEEVIPASPVNLTAKLATFPVVRSPRRAQIDIPAMDEAAATHGFTSREAGVRRRRRRLPTEETRHLAMRVTKSEYDRFEAYADDHKMLYAEALTHLMNSVGYLAPVDPKVG
jgi:hypothetical protein